jgi:RsmE family RNA methyltransferase
MNLLLLESQDLIHDDCALLTAGDPRYQHIRQILDAQAGESLRAGLLNGPMGQAHIDSITSSDMRLSLRLNQQPPAKLPLTVILALPRPKMIRRILRTIAEMGVPDLILINTYKVEKSYWRSPALDSASIDNYFLEGLQQARDTVMPTLRMARLFKPFVEDELPLMVAGKKALVAHPGDFSACPHAIDEPCALAIGPEGGFIDYEVEKLRMAGFTCVQMGERILRVETALTCLIGRLYC